VLVSEVMLQQTQATRVAPAFEAFMTRFPAVEALAAAPKSAVLRAWGTLGYNRRAVALSEAARMIVGRHYGKVPRDVQALEALPGVGPYTASAVAALGYGMPVAAVDTNVARVLSRVLFGSDASTTRPFPIRQAAERSLDHSDPGSWNQALMDLGREICKPRPRCEACPLASVCRFRRSGSRAVKRSAKQTPFPGSFRQVRGAVVRVLREADASLTVAAIAERSGLPPKRVVEAVRALAAEGIVRAGPSALAGCPAGRVRLPS
jgi:A/G-specific adenine glycosylase